MSFVPWDVPARQSDEPVPNNGTAPVGDPVGDLVVRA
jgi:hypothetical protein